MSNFDISLAFRDPPEWPDTVAPLTQGYTCKPYSPGPGRNTQPVLAGRTILRPTLDLSLFVAKATIDWIKVRMQTEDRHQARNMQPAISKIIDRQGGAYSVHVTGPEGETGYLGDEFILQFQDPDADGFRPLLEAILARYCDETQPFDDLPIAGIEIAVDFYVRSSCTPGGDDADRLRWLMVDLIRRHLRPHPVLTEAALCRPRSYGAKFGRTGVTFAIEDRDRTVTSLTPHFLRLGVDECFRPALELSSHNPLPVDMTYWVGAKGYPVALRSMDKVTDRRDPRSGTAVPLPPRQRRARLEVTLQGDGDREGGHGAVGLTNLGDLHGFKFESLRPPIFEFFLPTFGPDSDLKALPFPVRVTEPAVFERSGVYGLDRLHRSMEAVGRARYERRETCKRPTRLGKKGRLVSYLELNRRFDKALKGLSRRWGV